MSTRSKLREKEWHEKQLREDQLIELTVIIGGLTDRYDLEFLNEFIQKRLRELSSQESMRE